MNQSQNVGNGHYYGGEVSVSAKLARGLDAGFNYTLTKRSLHYAGQGPFELTGVPTHKGFAWIDWAPIAGLHILPSVEIASNRWTLFTATPSSQPPRYYRTGNYVNAALRIDYAVTDRIDIGVGARNLFDEYYVLTDGYPEPGRSLFASVRLHY